MSLEYADKCVAEALKAADGNQTKARQLIINQAMSDMQLLQALTRHHLKGIVAYHVERVASGRATKPQQAAEKPQKVATATDDEFGMEILKAIANSSSAVFGMETYASPTRNKTQASQQHINALKQMARSSKSSSKNK